MKTIFKTTSVPAICAAAVLLLGGSAPGQNSQPLTVEAFKGDLKVEVEVTGEFVADDKDEIRMEPSKYRGELIITRVLPEGEAVKKGDVLMEFDVGKLDDAIEAAKNEVTDQRVQLEKAKAELESAKIDAESKLLQLNTELTFIQKEVEAAQQKQALDLAAKEKELADRRRGLTDAEVDFEQLTQLYQARELHTATENILIEREKNGLVDLRKQLKALEQELEFFKKFEQAKDQKKKKLEATKKEAEIKRESIILEAAVNEKQAGVEKAQRRLDAVQKKVEGLQQDKTQLRVTSPRDGILFYQTIGGSQAGGLNFGFGNQAAIEVGGRVQTHSVLLTVATMENLSIKMQVPEHDVQYMTKGLPVTVKPNAFPSMRLTGKLTQVDQIASRTDIFSNAKRFTVRAKCQTARTQLKTGMNCQVTVHAKQVSDAVQVPIVAVIEDRGKYFCNVKVDNRYQKREVKIGLANQQYVQITEGLRTGEVVYLSDPSDG